MTASFPWVAGLPVPIVLQTAQTGDNKYWVAGLVVSPLLNSTIPTPTPGPGSSSLPTGLRALRFSHTRWMGMAPRRFAPVVTVTSTIRPFTFTIT